jgi:hypothetical protein
LGSLKERDHSKDVGGMIKIYYNGTYRYWVLGKPEGKILLGRPRRRWDQNGS